MKTEQETITGEQVEQTLEEKVREILEPAADFSELKVTDHSVEFLDNSNPAIWYFVTATEISYAPKGALSSRNTFTVSEYQKTYTGIPEINAALPKVAALLTPSDQPGQTLEEADTSKPSYSDLEQRVEELEEGKALLIKDCDIWKVMYEKESEYHKALMVDFGLLRNKKIALERENASLLDKFGPIDQAEQQVAEVETRFQKLAKRSERIADLLIQLNEEIL